MELTFVTCRRDVGGESVLCKRDLASDPTWNPSSGPHAPHRAARVFGVSDDAQCPAPSYGGRARPVDGLLRIPAQRPRADRDDLH
jgi:hypothetical protein